MQIRLEKFSASGNTFYLIDACKNPLDYNLSRLAQDVCNLKGQRAVDGLLVLENSVNADIKMRIFNSDGSEAQMCGNGARAVAFYLEQSGKGEMTIETIAGIIRTGVEVSQVRIRLSPPKDIKLNMGLEVNNRKIHVSFIDTGVPHVVVFVNALKRIDVDFIGRFIREHERFAPKGTNVNFVEITGFDSLNVRTYERGVESETAACGTGIVASALISFRLSFIPSRKIKVKPTSGEILTVEFEYEKGIFSDVYLKGKIKKLAGKTVQI